MSVITVDGINGRAKAQTEKFVKECEQRYKKEIMRTAELLSQKKGRSLLMIAGPSSSGKTTTAKLIKAELEGLSRRAIIISLDDFYSENNLEYYFEDGTVDYERIETLDTDYIFECLDGLMKRGRCLLPHFSFMTKKREGYEEITVGKDDVIIVEGLHALNPLITQPLEKEQMLRLYVSVSSRVYSGDEVFLSKRDIRFIRRLIRDYHFRNSKPDYTFYLWNGVRMGEDRYLFPFSDLADIKIDTIHPYEFCVFKDIALRLLDCIDGESIYFNKAQLLKEKLCRFEALDSSVIPENSLLKEFI